MSSSSSESIDSRCVLLNQLLLGKSHCNIPNKYLAHRDGLLDALFALYEECSADYLRKDKRIADFVDKYKGVMIELKSLRVNLKDFEVKKIIGRGRFGEVKVVREKASNCIYAMKVVRKQETLPQINVAFYEEEKDIMAKSNSPWITKLQYAFQDSLNLYLIMEFHPGGDMLSLLRKYDNVLPADMCQFYLAELLLAIHSLHTMGYVHRDIKPDNILIDLTGHLKLADFGSSSKLNHNKQVTSRMPVGSLDYVAPEILVAMNSGSSNKSYGIEGDWWSLGIVAYEMIFGTTPFANEKLLVTYNNIMHFEESLKFPEESSEVSDLFLEIIRGLLKDASTRLGYEELIVHPLFADIDWNIIRHNPAPYLPTVLSVDDTSNFDDFEPENRSYSGKLKIVKEFSGIHLPFVGFTYTTKIENEQRVNVSKGEKECYFENHLNRVYSTFEQFNAEKTELLEDLQKTRNTLLECQKKLTEREHLLVSFNSNADTSISPEESEKSELSNSKASPVKEDYKKLIAELEKKNIQLEHDLETAVCAKKETAAQCVALNNALVQLENQEKHNKKKTLEISGQTYESSKSINEKFARIEGQYEELVKHYTNLTKECEEKGNIVMKLLEEVKSLRNELQKECSRHEKINSAFKATSIEMEDLKVNVESREKIISELNGERDSIDATFQNQSTTDGTSLSSKTSEEFSSEKS